MKRQMLDPDNLRVDSFETAAKPAGVKALGTQAGQYTCYTCGISPVVADAGPTVYCCV
jgi:hypothetical protein